MGRGLISEMVRISSDLSPAIVNLMRAGLALDGYRVDAKADWREIAAAHEERGVIATLLEMKETSPNIAAGAGKARMYTRRVTPGDLAKESMAVMAWFDVLVTLPTLHELNQTAAGKKNPYGGSGGGFKAGNKAGSGKSLGAVGLNEQAGSSAPSRDSAAERLTADGSGEETSSSSGAGFRRMDRHGATRWTAAATMMKNASRLTSAAAAASANKKDSGGSTGRRGGATTATAAPKKPLLPSLN